MGHGDRGFCVLLAAKRTLAIMIRRDSPKGRKQVEPGQIRAMRGETNPSPLAPRFTAAIMPAGQQPDNGKAT